ncbi:MAG: chromosomal replication initiator protein DnaA [Phycisphaerales bacterium]|nr:chromosomal replication initiator protein DnaA [Phycisphaerales bacterium]
MNPTATQTVCLLQDGIEQKLGEKKFRTWFGSDTAIEAIPSGMRVTVPNAFVGNWIASNYMHDLVAVVQDVCGAGKQVELRIRNAELRATDAPAVERVADSRPRPHLTAPHRRETPLRCELESFVVGESNALAYSVATRMVARPIGIASPVVLHSGCGLGKTHLLQGICNGIRRTHPTLQWRYLSGEDFTNEFVHALRDNRLDQFRTRFRQVDVLLIDDIHFLAGKKATQDEFLHTFNAIDGMGKTVLLTSDRHPRALTDMAEPILNRLIAGLVVEMAPPEFATRREILRRRVESLGFELAGVILDFVAQHVTRNVRELEGALYRLVALASLTQNRIDLETARQSLDDYLSRERRPITLDEIIDTVATRFGISAQSINSAARDRAVSLARSVAMYLARKHTRMSFPVIARQMGGKSHSTVLMATQRVEETLQAGGNVRWRSPKGESDVRLAELIAEIERGLPLSAA